MFKKFKVIVEDATKAAQPKTGNVTAVKLQRQKSQTDRMSAKKASDSLPKNNPDVFSSKPEPNRGPGADRRPTVPRNHSTHPTMEAASTNKNIEVNIKDFDTWKGRAEKAGYHIKKIKTVNPDEHTYVAHKHEKLGGPPKIKGYFWHQPYTHGYLRYKYIPENLVVESLPANAKASDYVDDFVHSKNKMFKGDSKKQRIKRALGAFYGKQNEDAPAMAAGAAGDPGAVQNPTSNYAAQRDLAKKKKPLKTFMARRKKPVGEEFEAGIGNTQIKKDTKVKSTSKKKASSPPGNGGSSDQGMPIGGQ